MEERTFKEIQKMNNENQLKPCHYVGFGIVMGFGLFATYYYYILK